MSEPYIGLIIPVAFGFAPQNYLACNGQLLPISQYEVLYSLIGTTYGGDGQTTFALPNLQSRTAIGQGTSAIGSFTQGILGGQESVTLTTPQLPSHTHVITGQSAAGNSSSPAGSYFAGSNDEQYASTASAATAPVLAPTGGSLAHSNLQPYQALMYIIAVQGVFPTRN